LWQGRLAYLAFGRQVDLGTDTKFSTFPFYMTSRSQYQLGAWSFVAFACGLFLLLIQEHQQVLILAEPLHILPEWITTAVNQQSAAYLTIVAVMVVFYLFCLQYDHPLNPLLQMRGAIQTWISVPQMVKRIVEQIQLSLTVPEDKISAVAAEMNVPGSDFRKAPSTPERIWAEICYMKMWLVQKLGQLWRKTYHTDL
jgi:hypothetical protein